MRVIIDEGVPRQTVDALRRRGIDAARFPETWRGMKNGHLLRAAAQAGFDVLLTNDKNIADQISLREHRIAVIALPHNRRRAIIERVDDIAETIRRARPRQHVVIQLDGTRITSSLIEGRLVFGSLPPVRPFPF